MIKLKSILGILFFLTLNSNSFASHILSGNLQCHYLKTDSGQYVYAVNIELYRNCGTNQIALPSSLEFCVYDRDNISKTINADANLFKKNYVYGCYGVCIERAVYTSQIKLNANINGYSIKTEICCRAEALNLLNDQTGTPYQGYTFECFLKPEQLVTPPELFNPKYGNNIGILSSFVDNTYKIKLFLKGMLYDSIATTIEQPLKGASIQNNYPGCTVRYIAGVKTELSSGYSASNLLGPNGLISYNSVDSILTLKASHAGFYYFTIQTQLFKNSELIYSYNTEMVYNVMISQLPPVITLDGYKKNPTTLNLSWVPDCMEQPIVKNVVLKSIGSPDNFASIYDLAATTLTALDSNLPFKTKLYYKIMSITEVGDTFYSNVLETEMWNSEINSLTNQQLSITPNPGEGIFKVNIVDLSINSIQLTTIDGKIIHNLNSTTEGQILKLNLSDFSNGLYILRISTDDGHVYINKLIISQ